MKTMSIIILAIVLTCNLATAQDTMYVYRAGEVISKQAVAEVDSVIFYKPITPRAVVTDIDGNVYRTLTIDTQIWMLENLKTTKYNDGTSIPYVTVTSAWGALSTPGYCFYNNNAANKNIYGALYNWYTVNTNKLTPNGWHVATDAEWTILENYLIANGYNFDGTTTENKIAKSLAATTHWVSSSGAGSIGNDLTKNNTSGFTALPGGRRYHDGTFYDIGSYGFWWSPTGFSNTDAWYRDLTYDTNLLYRFADYKTNGISVRCVKDELPTLTSKAATIITTVAATCGGSITSDGGARVTVRGVCWSTSQNPTTANSKTSNGTGTGTFTSLTTGLTSNTTYYIRAYATNSVGTAYGNEMSFTTQSSVTDIDGNVYSTVKIGSQVWMVENLRTTKYRNGELIGTTTPATKNITSESTPKYQWAYNGNEGYVSKFGRLYTWYTVSDSRNIAPTGWHVSTDAEWTTLENYLIANGYNYDSTTTANRIAKSLAATTEWNSWSDIGVIGNDLTKNNTSSFTALPGGYRHDGGAFGSIYICGYWWSSTERDPTYAWYRDLLYYYDCLFRENNPKSYGYSIRCVKN